MLTIAAVPAVSAVPDPALARPGGEAFAPVLAALLAPAAAVVTPDPRVGPGAPLPPDGTILPLAGEDAPLPPTTAAPADDAVSPAAVPVSAGKDRAESPPALPGQPVRPARNGAARTLAGPARETAPEHVAHALAPAHRFREPDGDRPTPATDDASPARPTPDACALAPVVLTDVAAAAAPLPVGTPSTVVPPAQPTPTPVIEDEARAVRSPAVIGAPADSQAPTGAPRDPRPASEPGARQAATTPTPPRQPAPLSRPAPAVAAAPGGAQLTAGPSAQPLAAPTARAPAEPAPIADPGAARRARSAGERDAVPVALPDRPAPSRSRDPLASPETLTAPRSAQPSPERPARESIVEQAARPETTIQPSPPAVTATVGRPFPPSAEPPRSLAVASAAPPARPARAILRDATITTPGPTRDPASAARTLAPASIAPAPPSAAAIATPPAAPIVTGDQPTLPPQPTATESPRNPAAFAGVMPAAALAPAQARPAVAPLQGAAPDPVAIPAPIAQPATAPIAPAAPVLPAFRAFGAALHRAAAAERRALRDAPDPIATLPAPAPAQTVAPDLVPLDTTQPRWPDAMVARIEQLRDGFADHANEASTRIRLHPDALGHVDVALRREADGVHLRFAAAEPATARLLADAQPRLQELADARGLKLGGADVGAHGGGDRRQPTPQPSLPARPARAHGPTPAEPDTDTRLA